MCMLPEVLGAGHPLVNRTQRYPRRLLRWGEMDRCTRNLHSRDKCCGGVSTAHRAPEETGSRPRLGDPGGRSDSRLQDLPARLQGEKSGEGGHWRERAFRRRCHGPAEKSGSRVRTVEVRTGDQAGEGNSPLCAQHVGCLSPTVSNTECIEKLCHSNITQFFFFEVFIGFANELS